MRNRTSNKIDAAISDGVRMRPLARVWRKIFDGPARRRAIVAASLWVILVWCAVFVLGSVDFVRSHAELVVGIVLMVLPIVLSAGARAALRTVFLISKGTQTVPREKAEAVPTDEAVYPDLQPPMHSLRKIRDFSSEERHLSGRTLAAYVNGEMTRDKYSSAAQHISECTFCADRVAEQKQTPQRGTPASFFSTPAQRLTEAEQANQSRPSPPEIPQEARLRAEERFSNMTQLSAQLGSITDNMQKAGRTMAGADTQSAHQDASSEPRGHDYGRQEGAGMPPLDRTATTIAPMDSRPTGRPRPPLLNSPSNNTIGRSSGARGLKFNAASWSDAGPRIENQDGAFIRDKLLVIADGVGGRSAGAEAAREAIAIVARTMEHPLASPVEAVMAANDALRSRQVAEDYEDRGRATTLDIVYLDDTNDLGGAHVGDSRTYILPANGSRLIQLTTDHARGNILTRSIGGSETVTPDVWIHEIVPGDLVLMATDGLWKGRFDEQSVAQMMIAGRGNPPDRIARTLVETARDGAVDNITVIVAEVVRAQP